MARGVADHGAFRTERWGRTRRFHRTLAAMLRLCFGTEEEARAVAARIKAIHDRPAVWLMRGVTIGLLPPRIREGYGFAWGSRQEATLRLSAAAVRRLLPLTPSVVRDWPAARGARRAASPAGA